MLTPDFILRMDRLETEARESREFRQKRNEKMISLFDEERIFRIELGEEVDKMRENQSTLEKMHQELMIYLKGSLGYSGAIEEHIQDRRRLEALEDLVKTHGKAVEYMAKDHERIKILEDRFKGQTGFIAGAMFAGTVAGGIFTFLWQALAAYIQR